MKNIINYFFYINIIKKYIINKKYYRLTLEVEIMTNNNGRREYIFADRIQLPLRPHPALICRDIILRL